MASQKKKCRECRRHQIIKNIVVRSISRIRNIPATVLEEETKKYRRRVKKRKGLQVPASEKCTKRTSNSFADLCLVKRVWKWTSAQYLAKTLQVIRAIVVGKTSARYSLFLFAYIPIRVVIFFSILYIQNQIQELFFFYQHFKLMIKTAAMYWRRTIFIRRVCIKKRDDVSRI